MDRLEKKHMAERARHAITLTWIERVVKLPMSEQAFCKKYGINLPRFNGIKNGKNEYTPSQKYIDRIEWCLDNEDV